MNARRVALFLMLVLLLVGASAPLAAQDKTPPPGCVVVLDGDGFWRVAERHLAPSEWTEIYRRNPNRPDGKPRFHRVDPSNGWTYIWTKPGEFLCGLEDMGLGTPVLSSPTELEKLGFKVPKPEKVVEKVTVKEISPWSYLPLAVLLLLALALLALYLWFRRDPTQVGAGPVQIGGIQTPRAAADHFRGTIARENRIDPNSVRIISMVRGRAYGWARVIDRLGNFFHRFLGGKTAWEVTAQLPNGQQIIRHSLMGCANDVRGGGGMIPGFGFRFVADQNVTSEINPPTPPSPPPTPQPATQAAASGGSGGSDDRLAPYRTPEGPVAEQVQQAAPKPTTEPRRRFIRLDEADDSSPNRIKFLGIRLHEVEEDANGVTTIRYNRI